MALPTISPRADLYLPSAQHGFRPRRQISEIHFLINKIRESALEWRIPYVILKIAIRKAFDTIDRSAEIHSLRDIGAHPRAVWTLAVGETTSADMRAKESSAWSRFHKMLPILKQKAPLKHRLIILESLCTTKNSLERGVVVPHQGKTEALKSSPHKSAAAHEPRPRLHAGARGGEKIKEHAHHVRELAENLGFVMLDQEVAQKYWSWAGHLVRLKEDHLIFPWVEYRDLERWRIQQAKPTGGHHIQYDANLPRWEMPLVKYSQFGVQWKKLPNTDLTGKGDSRTFGRISRE